MQVLGTRIETGQTPFATGDVVITYGAGNATAESRFRLFSSAAAAQRWISTPALMAIDMPEGFATTQKPNANVTAVVADLLGRDPAAITCLTPEAGKQTSCYILRSKEDRFVLVGKSGTVVGALGLAAFRERLMMRIEPVLNSSPAAVPSEKSKAEGDAAVAALARKLAGSGQATAGAPSRFGLAAAGVSSMEVQALLKSCTCSQGGKLSAAPALRITSLDHGGAAESGGLQTGDVILSVNGQAVKTPEDLSRLGASVATGGSIRFEILRVPSMDFFQRAVLQTIVLRMP
jgi:hypothetical protein